MPELSDTRPVLSPLRRYWWFVLLAALVAGGAAYLSSAPAGSTTYGVVNTRTVASLPNDRIDLITDLGTAMTLPSVLEEPAEVAGTSVDALRDDVTVERIGSTSLARITYVADGSDEASDQEVITALVESAAAFLGQVPASASEATTGPLARAVQREVDTAQAMADMVADNGGVEPDREYAALQAAALADQRDGELTPQTTAQLEAAFDEAQEYQALSDAHTRAVTAVASLETAQAQQEARQASLSSAIPVSFEGDVATAGDVTAHARRVLGAAAAGAILGAVVVVAFGALVRRRNRRRTAVGAPLES